MKNAIRLAICFYLGFCGTLILAAICWALS